MSFPKTLLEEEQSLNIFKEMLIDTLKVNKPIVQLKNIPQWMGFLNSIGLKNSKLDNCQTLLQHSYFYNFSSSITDIDLNSLSNDNSCQIQLIPTIRSANNDSILSELGYVKIPSYVESYLELENSLNCQLLQHLGSKKFRNIIRLTNVGRKHYDLNFYNWKDIGNDNGIIKNFVKLHKYNTQKYNHSHNLFNYDSVNKLFKSKFRKNVIIGLRSNKKNNEYVHGFIFIECRKYSHIYLLAQGSRPNLVSNGTNLYITMFYELFHYAYINNYSKIFLGRGNQLDKKNLGANRFNVLNNWFLCNNNISRENLRQIKDKANIILENYRSLY